MSPSAMRSQTMPALSITPKAECPIRSFSLPLEKEHDPARRPVAHGGFSDVYRLFSPKYGPVAVKRFRLNENERDALERSIKKEARVLTMINHPHIVRFLGISYMDGAVCIVTPWATNGSLACYLRRCPEANRLGLLIQVASALSYLHEYTGDIIIHGDLHVDNVLVSDAGSALLSDFGLSRIVPEGNSSSLYRGDGSDFRIGRVVYEAPELHDGEPRSWATDVFAFGMLIFHAYSGKQPFGYAQSYLTAVVALYRGDRPDRREILRDDFSDDLWRLVQACWNHNPRQRPRMPEVSRRMQLLVPRDCPSSSSHEPELAPTSPQNTLDTGMRSLGGVLPSDARPDMADFRGAQPVSLSISYDQSFASKPDVQQTVAKVLRGASGNNGELKDVQLSFGSIRTCVDHESLMECGMLANADPVNRVTPLWQVAVTGKAHILCPADYAVGFHEKSPTPRRIKVIFCVALITCTATSALCALYAGAQQQGYAFKSGDREIQPSPDVARRIAMLAAYVPQGSSPPSVSDTASSLIDLPVGRSSQLIPRWLEQLLRKAVNTGIVVSLERFPPKFVS